MISSWLKLMNCPDLGNRHLVWWRLSVQISCLFPLLTHCSSSYSSSSWSQFILNSDCSHLKVMLEAGDERDKKAKTSLSWWWEAADSSTEKGSEIFQISTVNTFIPSPSEKEWRVMFWVQKLLSVDLVLGLVRIINILVTVPGSLHCQADRGPA